MDGHRRRFSLTANDENPQPQPQPQQQQDRASFFYVDREAEIIEQQRRREKSKPRHHHHHHHHHRSDSAERIKQSFERLEKDLGRVRRLLKIETPPHQPIVSISPPREDEDEEEEDEDDVNMYSPPRIVRRRPVITTSIKNGSSNTQRKHTTLAVISLDASPINTDEDIEQRR